MVAFAAAPLVVERLERGGLETKLYKSYAYDKIFCKIRCSADRLKDQAAEVGYPLLLDETTLAARWAEIKGGSPRRRGYDVDGSSRMDDPRDGPPAAQRSGAPRRRQREARAPEGGSSPRRRRDREAET